MSSPRLEDGYTRIANELLDAIVRFAFTKRQLKVLLALVRRTYGYGKKEDDITVTRLAEYAGLTRPHTSEAIDELVAIGAVLKRDGKFGYVLGIQSNYTKWEASRNGTVKPRPKTGHVPKRDAERPETGRTPSQNGTVGVPKRDTQKTILKRQSLKENPKRKVDAGSAHPAKPAKTTRKPKPAAALAPPKRPRRPVDPAKSAPVWKAYCDAYYDRYGTEPVRNAKVNGQITQLVARLGEEAAHVAAFYVRHNAGFYVRQCHAVGPLLADAEKLRTEWVTGRQVTAGQARQVDQTQTRGNVFNELIEEVRSGKFNPRSSGHG